MVFVPKLTAKHSYRTENFLTILRAIAHSWYVYIYFLLAISFFTYFWVNAVRFDENGNFVVTHISIWGDWAVHFTMGSAMAFRELFLDTSPLVYGAAFNYPFVSNMISAILIRLGLPFFMSFVLPSFFYCILLIAVLPLFYWQIFSKKTSIAILASLIFLLNGGTGFTQYITDIQESATPWQTALNPPKEYTHLSETHQIHWISIINSQIIPQRALTLGVPLSLILLYFIYGAWFTDSESKNKYISIKEAVAALLYGILPIVHAHSFIAVSGILLCWSAAYLLPALFYRKKWQSIFLKIAQFFIVSLSVAVPLLQWYVVSNASTSGFMKWHPGWYQIETPELSWFVFWIRNWSLTPILALLGFLHIVKTVPQQKKLQTFIVFIPFFVLFVLANLFLFQPHAWDNTKLFLWVSVGFSGLAAYAIYAIATHRLLKNRHAPIKIIGFVLATLLFVSITATGTIDNWRILRFDLHTYQMYSAEELSIAQWVIKETPKDAVWLTGDQHNHWVYNLTGRQTLLVFRGWLWTHGYDYRQAETDLSLMFTNPNRFDLFKKYNVQYAVIGPNELEVWKANKLAFDALHEVVWKMREQTVYKITYPDELGH